MDEEKQLNEAEQAHVATFDPTVLKKAMKLNMNYWNFGSTEELEAGIERFLEFNPAEAKLLEEEGGTHE